MTEIRSRSDGQSSDADSGGTHEADALVRHLLRDRIGDPIALYRFGCPWRVCSERKAISTHCRPRDSPARGSRALRLQEAGRALRARWTSSIYAAPLRCCACRWWPQAWPWRSVTPRRGSDSRSSPTLRTRDSTRSVAPSSSRSPRSAPYMVDDVIVNKVATIERCLARVGEEYGADERNLRDNLTRQDSIVLNLQRACEASIDLAMALVKAQTPGAAARKPPRIRVAAGCRPARRGTGRPHGPNDGLPHRRRARLPAPEPRHRQGHHPRATR